MREPKPSEFERLAEMVAADAGAPAFAALAEAHRRVGELERAREIAETGLELRPEESLGRVALALALLDLGALDAAKRELTRVFDQHPEWGEALADSVATRALASGDALDDGEIDRALDAAEAQADEMLDADEVAQRAMRSLALEAPEEASATSAPLFATETMARLLEGQGDVHAAAAIRSELTNESGNPEHLDAAEAWPTDAAPADDASPSSVAEPGSADRAREGRVVILEGWLQNIQRGRA